MFLDSGDGTVFKGAVRPWYDPKKGEFHLKPKEAKALLSQAIKSYKEQMGVIQRKYLFTPKLSLIKKNGKLLRRSFLKKRALLEFPLIHVHR